MLSTAVGIGETHSGNLKSRDGCNNCCAMGQCSGATESDLQEGVEGAGGGREL